MNALDRHRALVAERNEFRSAAITALRGLTLQQRQELLDAVVSLWKFQAYRTPSAHPTVTFEARVAEFEARVDRAFAPAVTAIAAAGWRLHLRGVDALCDMAGSALNETALQHLLNLPLRGAA